MLQHEILCKRPRTRPSSVCRAWQVQQQVLAELAVQARLVSLAGHRLRLSRISHQYAKLSMCACMNLLHGIHVAMIAFACIYN